MCLLWDDAGRCFTLMPQEVSVALGRTNCVARKRQMIICWRELLVKAAMEVPIKFGEMSVLLKRSEKQEVFLIYLSVHPDTFLSISWNILF